MAHTLDELLALKAELDAAIAEAEAGSTEPTSSLPPCTSCGTRPVRKAGAFLCEPCKTAKRGHESTGFVASRIRAAKTEAPRKAAANRAYGERVIEALSGVKAPAKAGQHVVVTTPEVMRRVNAVATELLGGKKLPGEVAQRVFDAKAHEVAITFDSAARAKAFETTAV